MVKKQFSVIGLGRFGGSICKELYSIGHEVMAIDLSEDKVEEYGQYATHAIQLDSTDERSLINVGIRNFDEVIVAIGDDIQASVLTTLLLKELGIKKVVVKAQNDYHHKVLEKIGADVIVHPEYETAKRVAHNLSSDTLIDFIDLSEEYSIAELLATSKMNNRSLAELDIRAKYGVTVLAYKNNNHVNIAPSPDDLIRLGTILVVMGHKSDLERFENAAF
ncbi:TrkA family potassium uptake protein [Jeotgalibacillus sp. HH7-29]|uniref:TrkA family potassium uptake protein n=1 Tax=Jeotgalibacillus haloalkalitolerans TaxID=3104292 RepID=A0ABU5KJW8_9BACL|nr:TrkA family potassium uptake protein [Jeotgalibacillus sp. HH7-29]MDZ5711015.1 TrkA family potassium uptake protein [Jeotgalibacillus sp. HH7-29]